MATRKWILSDRNAASSPVTIMTSQLSALANASMTSAVSVTNDSSLDMYADFELAVTYAVAPTADSTVKLFIVRTIDDSNFEDSNNEGRPRHGYVGGFVVDNVGTAQRLILPGVPLPPGDFQVRLLNNGGQAFTTTNAHTLRARFYNEQVV